MWKLYLARWIEDPAEVMRIYLAKAWLLLARPRSIPARRSACPAARPGPSRRRDRARRLAALGFVPGPGDRKRRRWAFCCSSLPRRWLALPSQTYAMPANAFVLVLLGVIVEFFARALLRVQGGVVITTRPYYLPPAAC